MPKNLKGRDIKIERKYECLRLRRKGLSYREIGEELNIDQTTACRNVKQCLNECIKKGEKDTEKFRQLELIRLDRMLEVIEDKIKKGDLQAIDKGLKIANQRAKLLGLDAPVQIEATENITFMAPPIERDQSKD